MIKEFQSNVWILNIGLLNGENMKKIILLVMSMAISTLANAGDTSSVTNCAEQLAKTFVADVIPICRGANSPTETAAVISCAEQLATKGLAKEILMICEGVKTSEDTNAVIGCADQMVSKGFAKKAFAICQGVKN